MTPDLAELTSAVESAAGRRPGTVLLRRANLINVLSGETYPADILLAGRLVAGVRAASGAALREPSPWTAETEIDLQGRYVAPGLVDGHVHLESAMVEPREYARAVVPRGITALVCDPHEIANVLGVTGIEYILNATEHLPMDVFVGASSCVPATTLETSGATLTLDDIDQLLHHPRVVAVAELMNFPGVVAGDPAELRKVLLAGAHRKVADGHAPLLRGPGLNAYLAAGISSDHESSLLEEAREKLRLGCMLMIRESTPARNLRALLPLVRPKYAHRICFVTDDRDPADLMDEGGVDLLVRRAIGAGIDPALAVRLASLNTAQHYRLDRRGAVAPGYIADLAVLSDLASYKADLVFKSGRLVARGGDLLADPPPFADARVLDTVRLPDLTAASFALPDPGRPVRAIELVPGEIITREVLVSPRTEGGYLAADPEQDIAKLAVVERHGRHGRVGVGLVKGLGLRQGAVASTVGHDSHNLTVAGVSDKEMLAAARAVAELGGGMAAVRDGKLLAAVPLQIAGLMSTSPLPEVRAGMDRLNQAAAELGVRIPSPFMTLSFLSLPVIPELKLTDLGLVHIGPDGLSLVEP